MGIKLTWKHEIGEKIINSKQNFLITDRFIKEVVCKDNSTRKYKYYKYTCTVCGFDDGTIEESNLDFGYGCSCCHGRTIVEGINDIPTTAPWMIPYFQGGYDEAKQYSHGSNKKIIMKCPFCNTLTKNKKQINAVYRNHSIGCFCSDGISYPEKFVNTSFNKFPFAKSIQLEKL